VGVHPADRVPDLVVVVAGVLGVVLGVVDALQQLRVEDRFLGAGVHLEAVGEFLPPLGQLGGVLERLDLGEGAPKDLVLAEHEHDQRGGRWSWRCGGFYRLRGMTRTTMRVMMLKIKPRIPNRTAL